MYCIMKRKVHWKICSLYVFTFTKKVLFTIKCFWKFCHGKCHIFTQTFIMFNCPWNRLILRMFYHEWMNTRVCTNELTLMMAFIINDPHFMRTTGLELITMEAILNYLTDFLNKLAKIFRILCFTVLMK